MMKTMVDSNNGYDKRKNAMMLLRYMLFNNVSETELEEISIEVHPYIEVEDFVVFCFAKKETLNEEELTVPGKYYYVRGENHLDLIIADHKYKVEAANKISEYYSGRSRKYHHFFELKQAFCEAAYMRRLAFKTCAHVVSAKYFQLPDLDHDYGMKIMMQTINLICSNRFVDALKQIEFFVSEVKKQKYLIDDFNEQMNIILKITINRYKNILNKSDEEEGTELLDTFSYQTIDEYIAAVKEWFGKILRHSRMDTEEQKTKHKMDRAITYIMDNYTTDLNMAVVSNYISMNYSLFSYTFKQYTGKNFVNFLKDIRVGEAKRLLVETDLKINEISKAVGYEHEKHFMKTFKAITGLTPSQYRNNFS